MNLWLICLKSAKWFVLSTCCRLKQWCHGSRYRKANQKSKLHFRVISISYCELLQPLFNTHSGTGTHICTHMIKVWSPEKEWGGCPDSRHLIPWIKHWVKGCWEQWGVMMLTHALPCHRKIIFALQKWFVQFRDPVRSHSCFQLIQSQSSSGWRWAGLTGNVSSALTDATGQRKNPRCQSRHEWGKTPL